MRYTSTIIKCLRGLSKEVFLRHSKGLEEPENSNQIEVVIFIFIVINFSHRE